MKASHPAHTRRAGLMAGGRVGCEGWRGGGASQHPASAVLKPYSGSPLRSLLSHPADGAEAPPVTQSHAVNRWRPLSEGSLPPIPLETMGQQVKRGRGRALTGERFETGGTQRTSLGPAVFVFNLQTRRRRRRHPCVVRKQSCSGQNAFPSWCS